MTRTCERCGTVFGPTSKRDRKSPVTFAKRRFCSKRCASMRDPQPCAVDGCEGRSESRGWCDKHYQRFKANGTPLRPDPPSMEERYWARVIKGDSPDDCWGWSGSTSGAGYGQVERWEGNQRHRTYAHRMSLQIHGVDIPEGMVVLHSCDNPPCTNPRHLRVGTQLDNMRDARDKGRLDLSGLELGRLGNAARRRAAARAARRAG